MLRWTEASASWSNCYAVATHEHATSTSFSTCLQLTGRDVEPEEPGRYGLGNLELMAPEDSGAESASPGAALLKMPTLAISVPAVPYGAAPVPGTFVANVTPSH
jgi:hypothetical protein